MAQQSTKADVAIAVKRLKDFYKVGLQSLRRHPNLLRYGEMKTEAGTARLKEEKTRKARQLASAKSGYSPKALELLSMHAKKKCFALSVTHAIRILTVPKDRRRDIEKRMIDEAWSVSRLEMEIAGLFGKRRHGGRRRKIPADAPAVLLQLEQMCEEWGRWYFHLQREPEVRTTSDGRSVKEEKCRLDDLPAKLRKSVMIVAGSVAELKELAGAERKNCDPLADLAKRSVHSAKQSVR